MIDTRHENELFYGNQENISCGICESFLEINDALLNNGYNINIWLILLTLSLAILMWYIFYKPMYWMKVNEFCIILTFCLVTIFYANVLNFVIFVLKLSLFLKH